MSGSAVLCVGSINADLTWLVEAIPRSGETCHATAVHRFLGGKGANQAVAAARLGARVGFVGAVGDDPAGVFVLESVAASGVDVSHVDVITGADTGAAFVTVDRRGENTIVVHPGANARLTAQAVGSEVLRYAAVLVTCLEIEDPVVAEACRRVHRADVTVVFTFAPARTSARALLDDVDVVVVNEVEVASLIGSVPRSDGEYLEARQALGVPKLMVTLGAAGAVVVGDEGQGPAVARVSGLRVEPIDTTGCGDAFKGALTAGLARREPMSVAAQHAAAVGALTATRPGAQPSFPTTVELARFLAWAA